MEDGDNLDTAGHHPVDDSIIAIEDFPQRPDGVFRNFSIGERHEVGAVGTFAYSRDPSLGSANTSAGCDSLADSLHSFDCIIGPLNAH